MSARFRSLALVACVTTGCYTTQNVVTMSPLETRYPVSASGQYVDGSGAVVNDDQYQVERPFSFEKTVTSPRHETTEAPLKLEPELDRIMAQGQGDAITNLKVEAVNYDHGSHGSAAGWKIMGWSFALTGGTFLAVGAASSNDKIRDVFVPVGAVTAGIGALCFLFGATAQTPAAWQFRVSGQVVSNKAGVAPATAPSSGAAPSPAAMPSPAAPSPAAAPAPASSGSFH